MCIICVQLAQDKLTTKEARRNMGEMRDSIEEDHRIDVLKAIWKKESAEEDQQKDSFFEEDWFADENWNGWGSD